MEKTQDLTNQMISFICNAKSFYKIRKSIAKKCDIKINVDPNSWKKDLPQLCAPLGLKYRASIGDVVWILKSSNAFSVKAIEAAGFFRSDNGETTGTKEVLWAKDEPHSGSARVQILIPMQYEPELASGESNRRRKFELFVKTELSAAFGVPKSLLSPEVRIAEIQEGSVLVTVILSASALILVCVGRKLPQTATWQEREFEILMAMGGLATGTALGVLAGGPTGAVIGALIGWAVALITAWFLDRDVRDAKSRALACFIFIGAAIVLIIEHFGQDDPTEQNAQSTKETSLQ